MAKIKFHVLNEHNGLSYVRLISKVITQDMKLRALGVYVCDKKLLYSLEQMARKLLKKPDWLLLPDAIKWHATTSARKLGICPKKWRTTLSIPGLPKTGSWDRFARQPDGTVITLDLGKTMSWLMKFDKTGNIHCKKEGVDILSGSTAESLDTTYHKFAKALFQRCDVLVMEDFRHIVVNRDQYQTDDYRWILDIQWDKLFNAILIEAFETRRRIILVSSAGTSWTCPQCHSEYPDLLRGKVTDWRCQNCKIPVDRNEAACLELMRRWLDYRLVTYDIATRGRIRL